MYYMVYQPCRTVQLTNNTRELVCRTCLKMSRTYFNIFKHKIKNELLVDMLINCTSVEIQKEDGFPIICKDCMQKLTSASDFKAMVIKSNMKLHGLCHEGKEVKKEEKSYSNDVQDISEETDIKIEQTTITGVRCKYEDAVENQGNKEGMNIEKNDGFLDDFDGTSLCLADRTRIRNPSPPSARLHDKNDHLLGNQTEKEEIGNNTRLESQSLDEDDCFSDDLARASSDPEGPITEKYKKIEQTVSVAKQKRRGGNVDNYDQKHAELLNNPDVKRIMSSDLPTRQKNRETVFCVECNKTFSFRYYITIHAYTHTGKVPYKCNKCEKRYPKETLLKQHMQSHLQTRDFPCDVCGKAFFNKHLLQSHKAQKHSEERPYKCNVCDQSFKVLPTLSNHLKRHMKDRKYVCETCGKTFYMKALKRHMESHNTEKKFVCTTCGKAFPIKNALSKHLKKHLGVKPYVCSYCGKRFYDLSQLKNHILTHTGAKPHPCKICGKHFRQRACLGRHMRIHTGENPFPCNSCPSSFKYSRHLLNHMRVHEKEPVQSEGVHRKPSDDDDPLVTDC